ncbi:MAG: phosphate ABC transporter substrate-binding protein [Candidatus Omnitrophica bacterium]|nr:phosphate ABC transporter substrate-binding protein [Candidatus Omnitrophota bacterium]
MRADLKKQLCYALTGAVVGGLLVFPSRCAAKNSSLQIKGSDTMVNLAQAWAEVFMEKNTADFVAVTGGGSGTGMASLISGTCDLAMSSRPMKDKEINLAEKKGIHPVEIKAALDGLAVVVHPKNPVNGLTLEQLSKIFSGAITNWREVGGEDRKIVLLSREVNSGTHVYFKEHVLRRNDPNSKEEFAPAALMLPSSQAIADEVAGNPAAIGYYGMGYLSDKQKALPVAVDAQSPFVAPTVENVMSGHYPISRPLFLYAKGEPAGDLKRFVDFIQSPEGQDIVRETDFVPAIAAGK